MKTVKSFKIAAVMAAMMLFTVQCDLINDDLLDSPNSVSPEKVNPDFLLSNIQFNGLSVYSSLQQTGAELTRMIYLFGSTYDNAFSPLSFNGVYSSAYSGLMIDVQVLEPIAQERSLFFHLGIAKTLKAYALLAVVDAFGDMPYSQALDASNFNPGLDDDEAIYAEAITLLDGAIADFSNQSRRGLPAVDLYYGHLSSGDRQSAWIRFANTLKLKAYLNTDNLAGINAVAASLDNIISAPKWDFTFRYGSNDVNPDSRHPFYSFNYDQGSAEAYMSVGYMNMLLNDKPFMDPRLRYYMYRQTNEDTQDTNENRCITEFAPNHFNATDPFCLLGNGWWGRDHLINDGIPPDGTLRTTIGVYPAGGQFDANQATTVSKGLGLGGVGIEPIMMSFYTHFMVAEAKLRLGNDAAGAWAALEDAIELSMSTVASFGSTLATGTGFEITPAGIQNYIDEVADRWNNMTTKQAGESDAEYRLRLLAKEYYLALWTNGYEAYNLMRRTGYPNRLDNLQPARVPEPGKWYRSFLYPASMVERNSSISQKTDRSVGPFWDKGKGNFDF
jgi:hypothetical protein